MGDGLLYVGPAGWSYEDWKGIVYPNTLPKGVTPLSFISSLFDVVEVNSTFYHPPKPSACASWVAQTEPNPSFRFTVKLWDRFTHQWETWPTDEERRTFREGIEPLLNSGKLGAVLLQFPWSFKRVPDNRRWLARLIEELSAYPLAVEVRHASWDRAEVYEALAERNVAFCNIDQPVFSGSLTPSERVTSRMGYVRLHGRNAQDWFRKEAGRDDRYNYLYSRQELSEWIKRIKRIRAKTDETFVIANNHYNGQAVVNAFEINHMLKRPNSSVPPSLLETYPRLAEIE